MKTIETTKQGKNFTVVNVGKLSDIKDYLLTLGDIKIPGKVFVGQALNATGSELSFQSLAPTRIAASCILIRITRNFISFLKVKAFIKWTEKRFL